MRADLQRGLWLSILLFSMLCGCGTPGVPQPPSLNLAKPVSDLKAVRSANHVTLSWTVPTETTDGAAFRHRGTTKVCNGIDQAQLSLCPALKTLETPTGQKTGSFTTDLSTERSGPNDYVTYALEVDNDRGRSAGLSNQVQVPTAAVSKLSGVSNALLIPDAVVVTVVLDPENEGVQQAVELRRTEKGTPRESTVERRPLQIQTGGAAANIELRDESFAWEKTYDYRVVLVATTKLPNGAEVTFDAALSTPVEITTHDVFPPAVPTGLQAVFSGPFAGGQPSIDITWSPDSDRDLAGYFVYRRRQDESLSNAVKLNGQPVPTPSYRDTAIQPGNTFVYSVSAVDERGNESKRSEETSEQVPK